MFNACQPPILNSKSTHFFHQFLFVYFFYEVENFRLRYQTCFHEKKQDSLIQDWLLTYDEHDTIYIQ